MAGLSTILELVGIATVVSGVFVWAGFGPGLLAAGIALVIVGVAIGGPRIDDERS